MMAENHPTGIDLQAYHDGELSSAEAERVAEHIRTCTVCEAELADLEAVGLRLDATTMPGLSEPIWSRLQRARREEVHLGPAFTAVAAAACLVGLLIGIWFGPLRFNPTETARQVATLDSTSLFDSGASTSLLDVFYVDQE